MINKVPSDEVDVKQKTTSNKISWFPNIKAPALVSEVLVEQVLREIKSDKYKMAVLSARALLPDRDAYNIAKSALPAVTFGGTFSYRNLDSLTTPSGFIPIDVDDLSKEQTETLFTTLINDIHTWAMFRSPSGEGLKILFRAEGVSTPGDHEHFYEAVKTYFDVMYSVEICPAGKDICRLCFMSWDPDLYVNPSPLMFSVEAWAGAPKASSDTMVVGGAPDAEWWDGKIKSLPVSDRVKNLITGAQGGEDRSADMMTVINQLAYCQLSDSQIYQIFAENPIGDKSREKNDPEKWLKPQIDNGRGFAAAELGFYTTPQEDFGTPIFTEDATVEWDDPIPLGAPTPPAFTSDDFPEPLWEIIDAVSKALEVPTELPGLLALGVVAASVQKKMVVSPEPGYVEPLNIFCNVVLPPGERKSGVLKILTSPLIAWEIHQSSIFGFLIKEAVITKANHDARITSLRGRYAKEKDPAKREALQNEMLLLAQETPNIPVAPQLWTQDCTPERLGSLLSDNDERMAVLSAEGGIFDIISGRYSNGTPNLDVFLQGHAGDSVRVDRAGRDAIWLKEPALTMILSTQPDVLQSMADKRGFRGRGLVARFLYAVPSSAVGKRCLKACPVPTEVDLRYQSMISSLLNMIPLQDPVQFEKEAHTIWKEFAIEIEHELAEGGRFEHMRDWAGKLPGAAVRIAGLYHSIKIAGGLSIDALINAATMEQALSLSRKLMPHVESAYALMGSISDIEEACSVLAWMKRQGNMEFSMRECYRALRGVFQKREDLDPAVGILEERGYIRKLPPKKTAGRQPEKYTVNPKVFS